MPLFARRRLKSMLDEMSEHLDGNKRKDLVKRLEHQNTKTALAAEAELSMLWAISRVAHLVVEPKLPNSARRPEGFSSDLFPTRPAIIEVRALSDDSFSGQEAMERTANIIANFADSVKSGRGDHLYFTFNEHMYWTDRLHRERCVDPKFELTDDVKATLLTWLTNDAWPTPETMAVKEGKTDVTIKKRDFPSRHFRTFCTMPPLAYDMEDNPIYKALKKKSEQLRGASNDTLRCVFLVDTGCQLLRRLDPMGINEIGGAQIISHALRKLSIDSICVFSPFRTETVWLKGRSTLVWKVQCFDSRDVVTDAEYARLEQIAAQLPPPRFEGNQARDIHRQGGYKPDGRGWYLGTKKTTRGRFDKMTLKVSSRLVQEFLAGRISRDQFHNQSSLDDKNLFELALSQGRTIQHASFESGGLDEDDDLLVFDFGYDAGASTLDASGDSTSEEK